MTVKAFSLCAALALLAATGTAQENGPERPYPFERFVGEWKLKDDQFQQVWDGKTLETLSIPGHRTNCAPINTDKSILCEVDAVDFKGHILWAVDDRTNAVSHLSHFGERRLGRGTGHLEDDGNLMLNIRFTDEPEGTSRKYTYTWASNDEYIMRSVQFDEEGKPTGNWYGGTFVRVKHDD